MKFQKLIHLGVAAALMLAGNSAQAGDPLRVGVEGAYPPFSWKEADGTLKGFDIDFAHEVCKRLNRECVLVEQEWDGMIPALLAKKFDTIIASMSITEERKKKVDFTVKYYNTPAKLVAKKNPGFEGTAAGLNGKRLGVQRATTHQCSAEKLYPGAELVLYATQEEVWQDLASGRLDAQLSDSLQAYEGFLALDAGKGFDFLGGAIDDIECQGVGAGFAVRKEDSALRDSLSKAIGDIRADGTYKVMNDKYFAVDIYGN
ncbi:MAG: transporter substrate-binding domain-containing protein [Pseudomonadota bacterium]|jgi:polar amino acid transport system substrate-binding protein/arginine/ornithine transport system substrate-binding protein|nr:transporter substrate-binding domain-containing protein [Pseudomonadota bacterium]MED5407689.1 transporter substrate-binding domain-containing protein [Pseudomonadota bacterium]